MVAELIVSAVASVALSTPKVAYNVAIDDKKVTNIEVYSVSEGKYLHRKFKMDFVYNVNGEVTEKNTYQWDANKSGFVFMKSEKFTNK